MHTYIAILRGINVSGHNKITMKELLAVLETVGLKNAKSYIQSGNVIFQAKEINPQDLEKRVSKKILETFTFKIPVIVIVIEEMTRLLHNNPFVNKRNEDVSKLHVTFLSGDPGPTYQEKINQGQYAPDEFIISGKVIYLFCPGGYGNTKLSNAFFENKLKVVATTRNWKTVNELANIANIMDVGKG